LHAPIAGTTFAIAKPNAHKMIKAFIFDLDGVITDTAEHHYLAWNRLAGELGWNFDREVNEKLRGVSRMDSIRIIQAHNNVSLPEEELTELATRKNEYYLQGLEHISPEDFLPGAKELLTQLKSAGYKIALGSASKNSHKVLEQLQGKAFFDVIGDGNSVDKSKPAPDIFLFGAEQLGYKPAECIVFEDAESGVDAAKAGGFYSVGIGPEERVGHADLRFDSMKEATLFSVKSHFQDLF